jgi:hypothetical protein
MSALLLVYQQAAAMALLFSVQRLAEPMTIGIREMP